MADRGRPRRIPANIWPLVAAELDAGATYEQVQAELARSTPPIVISVSMLQRYRAEDRKRLRGGAPEIEPDTSGVLDRLQRRSAARGTLEDTTPAAEPMPNTADLETLLPRLIRDSGQAILKARRLGDAQMATRETKNMAELTAQLGRVQKERSASRDVLSFTRAEIDAGMRSVFEKVAAVKARCDLQGGLACNLCARELVAALTGVDLVPHPEA